MTKTIQDLAIAYAKALMMYHEMKNVTDYIEQSKGGLTDDEKKRMKNAYNNLLDAQALLNDAAAKAVA